MQRPHAAAWARSFTPRLLKRPMTWLFTVCWEIESALPGMQSANPFVKEEFDVYRFVEKLGMVCNGIDIGKQGRLISVPFELGAGGMAVDLGRLPGQGY